MKDPKLHILIRNGIILACIIGVAGLLRFIPLDIPLVMYLMLRVMLFQDFFDSTGARLESILPDLYPHYQAYIAFFWVNLLLLSVIRLKKKGKTMFLKLSFAILFISAAWEIPPLISGYFHRLENYNSSPPELRAKPEADPPVVPEGTIVDDNCFPAFSKPSLLFYTIHLLILLGYIVWSAWQIWQLYKFDKRSKVLLS